VLNLNVVVELFEHLTSLYAFVGSFRTLLVRDTSRLILLECDALCLTCACSEIQYYSCTCVLHFYRAT